MSSREKNTKERILEEALRLFAQSGYMTACARLLWTDFSVVQYS